MATFEASYGGIVSTLANYKLMGKAVQDALVSFGWEQTADTGQVTDWTALGAIAATEGAANFMVFTNSGSAMHTTYVRIGFWVATTNFGCKVIIGHSTDGAGTITGTTMTNTSSAPTLTAAAGLNRVLASGDAEGFIIQIQEATSGVHTIGLDRSRDNSGSVTDEYYWAFCGFNTGGTVGWSQCQLANGTVSTYYANIFCIGFPSASHVYNGTAMVSPCFPIIGKIGNPTIRLMAIGQSDAAFDSQIQVNLYGVTRTFRTVGDGSGATPFAPSAVANTQPLILWE